MSYMQTVHRPPIHQTQTEQTRIEQFRRIQPVPTSQVQTIPTQLTSSQVFLSQYILAHTQYRHDEESSHRLTTFSTIPSVIERATECSVCYNEKELLNLPCGHVTCHTCYTTLPKPECPVCREKIVHKFVRRIVV